MIKKWRHYLALLPISLSGCTYQQEYQIKQGMQANACMASNDTIAQPTDRPHKTITIWVHGTRFSQHILKNFFRSIPGLQLPSAYNESNNQFDIAQALFASDPLNFPLDDMRLFGWSGKLSPQARLQAAKDLYRELLELIKEYEQKYGFKPRIRIITHSHGGNVAFLLYQAAADYEEKLVIDELILLACPVQRATMCYTTQPMFKKIIAIYSPIDLLQVADPQGLYDLKDVETGKKQKGPFFSNRCFPDQENLIQIKVRRHGHGLSHLTFIQKQFLKALPHLLNYLETMEAEKAIHKFKHDGFLFSPMKMGSNHN